MKYFEFNTLQKVEHARHEFDMLKPPDKQRIELRRGTIQDIGKVCELTSKELPGDVATYEVVHGALTFNKNNILMFRNKDKVVGVWAMLMLNHLGLERLLLGELDTLNPPLKCLSYRLESPMGIYVWAVVAPGIAVEGIKHVSHFLRQPIYRNTNLFSRPNTDAGVRINKGLGFKPITSGTNGLYRYIRAANRKSEFQTAA